MRWRTCLIAASMVVAIGTADARAQAASGSPRLRAGRPSVSIGALVSGGYPVGDGTAELRRNAAGTTSPPPFTLFRASTEMNGAAGVDARLAWPLTPSVALEVGGAYSRPGLAISIDGDAEGPATTLDETRVAQYVVDASLVWQLSRVRMGNNARPFLSVGGGYLRQLYDERTRIETGQLFHVGAGVRYWLRGGRGPRRDVGVRGEVRYHLRRQGVEFEGAIRGFPSASLSLFVGL